MHCSFLIYTTHGNLHPPHVPTSKATPLRSGRALGPFETPSSSPSPSPMPRAVHRPPRTNKPLRVLSHSRVLLSSSFAALALSKIPKTCGHHVMQSGETERGVPPKTQRKERLLCPASSEGRKNKRLPDAAEDTAAPISRSLSKCTIVVLQVPCCRP